MGLQEFGSEKSAADPETKRGRAVKSVLTVQAAYLFVVVAIGLSRNILPGPEFMFVAAAAIMMWRADTRKFLVALVPFMLLLFSYGLLRAYADDISPARVHYLEMIRWDSALFCGTVPAVFLNQWLRHSSLFYVVLPLANMFYWTHYVGPVIVAVVLWQRAREHYWRFVIGLVLLSYAGFVTHLLYPAAPPWLAAMQGYLPRGVASLMYGRMFTLLKTLSPNVVAAMPSLHAAYPVFLVLYLWHVFGRRVWPTLILPAGVWLSTLLLAQHYVVDLLAGAIYAWAAFFIATRFRRATPSREGQPLEDTQVLEPVSADD